MTSRSNKEHCLIWFSLSMNQSKHESILFWECENNCLEVLISQAVSEHILWADSRDKPIGLPLVPAPNSLWLMVQSIGAFTVRIPQRNRHGHAFSHTCRYTSLIFCTTAPRQVENLPKLTELYLENDLKTNSVCVGTHTTVYIILKEKQTVSVSL